MKTLNRVEVIGRVGSDPKVYKSQGGKGCCRFSVATSNNYTNDKGEWVDKEATWHNVVAWGAIGDAAAIQLHKGDLVLVIGKVEIGKYRDDAGIEKTSYSIVATDIFRPLISDEGGRASKHTKQEEIY